MKVVLVDDERLALDYLESKLQKVGATDIVGKFDDPQLCYDYVLNQPVDVVFMDIHMPETNGIELAERLLEHKPDLNVIFCTAYDEYAIKAFEMNALDYLLKPVQEERLLRTMKRIKSTLTIDPLIEEAKPAKTSIQLKMFQQLLIETRDGHFMPIRWRTSKAQELFLYLLQHREQSVSKSVLIELLWPEFEMNRAFSQLYTNVYYIRKTLEPFKEYLHISNELEGYILHTDYVRLDVEEWENNVHMHLPITDQTIQQFEDFMPLYLGDYLEDSGYWWAERERYRLQTLWVQTTTQMAEWYLANRDQDKAVKKYLEICDRYPLTEEAHFSLMKLYAQKQKHLLVDRHYRRLSDALQKELNEQPSPYIEEWYKRWKQENQ